MNITTEITEFIKRKENIGALLINGKWGCGKTHFIKNMQSDYNKCDNNGRANNEQYLMAASKNHPKICSISIMCHFLAVSTLVKL